MDRKGSPLLMLSQKPPRNLPPMVPLRRCPPWTTPPVHNPRLTRVGGRTRTQAGPERMARDQQSRSPRPSSLYQLRSIFLQRQRFPHRPKLGRKVFSCGAIPWTLLTPRKTAPISQTSVPAQPTAKPRLVAKSGSGVGSALGRSSLSKLNGAGTGPDPNMVWNKNRRMLCAKAGPFQGMIINGMFSNATSSAKAIHR